MSISRESKPMDSPVLESESIWKCACAWITWMQSEIPLTRLWLDSDHHNYRDREFGSCVFINALRLLSLYFKSNCNYTCSLWATPRLHQWPVAKEHNAKLSSKGGSWGLSVLLPETSALLSSFTFLPNGCPICQHTPHYFKLMLWAWVLCLRKHDVNHSPIIQPSRTFWWLFILTSTTSTWVQSLQCWNFLISRALLNSVSVTRRFKERAENLLERVLASIASPKWATRLLIKWSHTELCERNVRLHARFYF